MLSRLHGDSSKQSRTGLVDKNKLPDKLLKIEKKPTSLPQAQTTLTAKTSQLPAGGSPSTSNWQKGSPDTDSKFSEKFVSDFLKESYGSENKKVDQIFSDSDTKGAMNDPIRRKKNLEEDPERPSQTVDATSGSLAFVQQQNDFAAIRQYLEKRRPRFADFTLKATVGTGTFGRVRVVKLASSSSLGHMPFALKILKKSEVIRLKQVEHVKAEKQILLRIAHPFIVNLLYSFQDDRRLFMLMEYVNGGELFNYLRHENRLPNDHGRFYAAEIVLAYEYLHSLSIVYRDLKPENLLIDCEGHIKMTDFGFAKIVEDRTWTLCGTPEYLAPELIQNKGHNKSVDWWALGVLIFEMLTGYPPYYDENPFGIYQKVLSGKVDYPKHLDPRAKDLIKKLLTHDRTKRYGCLKYGAEDVKRHRWFKGIDWTACVRRKLTPPFVPDVASSDDTAMFDEYPESTEDDAPVISSGREVFADF